MTTERKYVSTIYRRSRSDGSRFEITSSFVLRRPYLHCRLSTDVAAIVHPFERNVPDAVICAGDRILIRRGGADDGEHAAAGRDELSVAERRACVIHRCAGP